MKLTSHLHVVLMSKMCGATPPLPQHIIMGWCLVKHRDSFTFLLLDTVKIDSVPKKIFPSNRPLSGGLVYLICILNLLGICIAEFTLCSSHYSGHIFMREITQVYQISDWIQIVSLRNTITGNLNPGTYLPNHICDGKIPADEIY
jgi:hypothetical protein